MMYVCRVKNDAGVGLKDPPLVASTLPIHPDNHYACSLRENYVFIWYPVILCGGIRH